MLWLFALLGVLIVVGIGLVVLGRETARLAAAPKPAVFDMAQAVDFIADRLSPAAQARVSHDDVRWVLMADSELLESVAGEGQVQEDAAVARILEAADRSGRDLADQDVVAILDARLQFLEAIGAIGPRATPGP